MKLGDNNDELEINRTPTAKPFSELKGKELYLVKTIMNKYFFRIGNFANNYGNENYIISEYDFTKMESIDTEAFQPIPLSEEWLVKLGFNKDPENIGSYYKDVNDQEKLQIAVEDGDIKEIELLYINNFAEKGWEAITNQSKFFTVHYLQNLILDHKKAGYPLRY